MQEKVGAEKGERQIEVAQPSNVRRNELGQLLPGSQLNPSGAPPRQVIHWYALAHALDDGGMTPAAWVDEANRLRADKSLKHADRIRLMELWARYRFSLPPVNVDVAMSASLGAVTPADIDAIRLALDEERRTVEGTGRILGEGEA